MNDKRVRSSRGARVREIAVGSVALLALSAVLVAVLAPLVSRSVERSRGLRRLVALEQALLARAASGQSAAACRAFPSRGDILAALPSAGDELASWASIGGCGVGGSGGGGGARWIGRRTGTTPEFELLGSLSAGEDLSSSSMTFKATADVPAWRLNLGLQVPHVWNDRYYEDFVHPGRTANVNGFGDLSLMVSRQFGLEGDASASLTFSLPTAPYDQDVRGVYIPYDAQLGIGKATAGITLEQSLNKDWGPVILGGGYTHNGGENDIENRRADTLQGYCYVGYRTELMVHSVGAKLSYALQKDINAGAVVEDQSKMLLTLQYGLEISITYDVPMFVALLATIGEQSSANSTSLALGVVAAF